MSLVDLETRLRAGVGSDGALHLTPAAYPELAEVLGHLRLPGLVLTATDIGSPRKGVLTFLGTTDLLGTAAARVTWEVRGNAPDQVTLTLPLASGWKLENAFPGLPQSARADAEHREMASLQPSLLYDLRLNGGSLLVRKTADATAPAGISFSGRARFPAGFDALEAQLGVDETAPVRGRAVLAAGQPASVDVVFASRLPALQVGSVRVDGKGLHVRTRDDTAPGDERTVIEYEGTMKIGSTQPLLVDVVARYGMDNGLFTILAFPAPGQATLSRGVTAVAEWAGGDKTQFTVPDPLKPALDAFAISEVAVLMDTGAGVVRHLSLDVASTRDWPIVDGLKVTDVHFGWLVLYPFSPERTLSGGVTGTLEFGTTTRVRFDVQAHAEQRFRVRGELRAGDRIDLTGLIETGLGFSAGLPRLDVDQLAIEADTSGDFLLDGSVSSDWGVDIGHRRFAVERVTFHLQRSGTSTLAQVYGLADVAGSRLYLQATVTSQTGGSTGVEFQGGTLPDQTISLTGVVSWALDFFGASLPSGVPDVTLSNLQLRFNTATKEFHFEGATDVPIQVPFLAGDDNRIHAAANLTSRVDGTGKRVLTGWMEGDLVIGASTFALRYDLGQASHVFRASWQQADGAPPLGINTLLAAIGADALEIPAGVDLNLKRVYFEYQAEAGSFTVVADSATYGEAFLVATRPPATQTGGWSYVFGLQYHSARLSQVPVLGSALGAADVFSFRELGILAASADVARFTLPQLPPLQTGDGTGTAPARTPVAAGTTVPLPKGITFIGVIGLADGGGGGAVSGLRQVLPGDTLTITAAYDATASEFELTGILDGSVTIPTGGGSDLRIGNASVKLQFPDLAITILGTLDFSLDHHAVTVTPRLSITETSLEGTVSVEIGDGGWNAPMGIQGLSLDEVDLGLGVTFLPAPGVNLGLEGKAHVGDAAPKSDMFAFVLEIVEEVPNPLLLAFDLDQITVREALIWFAPGVPVGNLPDFVNQVRFSDVSFFWAESQVVMPDGTVARPGLRFRGTLEVFGMAAHAAISVDSAGLVGEIMLAPIHLGSILSVTGAGTGVYRNQRDGKPVPVSIRPDPRAPAAERVQLVAPGGPVVQFRTQQSPWLYASIDVSLFGAASAGVEALVSEEGVHFKLVLGITDAVSAELDCTASKSGFKAHAKFGLHLKADLGPIEILGVDLGTIHLDAGFDLEMTVEVSADRFVLKLSGDFEFEGARLSFPTLSIDVAPASLAELPGKLISHLGDNLEEIFADLFNEAGRLLAAAGKEIAAAAEAVADEVAKIGTEAVQEAERIAREAEEAVTQAAEAVAREAERVEQEAVKIAQDAVAEVEKIGEAAVQEVEKIGGEIAEVATAAAHEVEAIGREIAHEAEQVEQAVVQLAEQTVEAVQQIAHAVEAEVQQIFSEAQRVAADVINAARAVADELARQAQALWDEARHIAEEIADALRRAADAVADAAKSAWHAISSY